MDLKSALNIASTVLAVLIVGLILLQPKGVGLSRSFSGFGGFYRSKRGLERLIFILTIISSLAFVTALLATLYFR
jgi:preprotein translocase subunit SecG